MNLGKWDFNALEIHPNELPISVMEQLGKFEEKNGVADNFFRAYHTFKHDDKMFLHVGWNSANGIAYNALKGFADQTNRTFLSSYHELSSFSASSLKEMFYKDRGEEFEEAIWSLDKSWLDEAVGE